MRYNLAGGWYLQRVEVNSAAEWVICDPNGDRLGNTEKHKAEFDTALLAELRASAVTEEELRQMEVKALQDAAALGDKHAFSAIVVDALTRRPITPKRK